MGTCFRKVKALYRCQGIEWDSCFSNIGTQKDNGRHRIKEHKSAYFRDLISPLRICATANIIVLLAIVETAVTLGSSSYLCVTLGNVFNPICL